jgi:hypothetical protein
MDNKKIIHGIIVEKIDSNILRYEVPKDGIITQEVVTELWENGNLWFPDCKRKLLGVFNTNFNSTKEAGDFMASEKRSEKILAEALCVNSAALRFKANFYFKVKKPHIKTRVFATEKQALEWLRQL